MADTKEKLVSAAISLLEEGSEEEAGFTMRAIAQRAGVGLGCANYHFGSKDACWPPAATAWQSAPWPRMGAGCGTKSCYRSVETMGRMCLWDASSSANGIPNRYRRWGFADRALGHSLSAGGPGAERDGYSGPALGRHARGSAGSLYAQRPPGLRLFSAGGMQGVSGSGFFRATRRRASRLPRSYKEAVIWS